MDHHINSKNESVFIALYIFSFLFSVIALTYLRFDNIPQIYVLFIVISTPIYFFVSLFLRCASIYDFRITNLITRHVLLVFIVLIAMNTITFALKVSEGYSRLLIFQFFILTLLINLILLITIKKVWLKGILTKGRSALIVSKNVDDDEIHAEENYDLLVNYNEVSDLISPILLKENVTKVYIYLTKNKLSDLDLILDKLAKNSFEIYWILPKFSIENSLYSFSNDLQTAIPLTINNQNKDFSQLLMKRIIDVFGGIIALILFSPLMLIVSLIIKASDRGPILYIQERNGLNGKTFKMLKFRSMKIHNDSNLTQAKKNDTRITWIGSLIRKGSIDELPQFLNVLRGDMSLVGPRPHAIIHNNFYSTQIKNYMHRHRVIPGMTGLAQINGFRGETEELEKMESRIKYDLEYINTWTIYLDLKILFLTPIELFKNIKQTY